MEITDKDIAQLDAFWHDELPENERLLLQKHLDTDPEFRAEANKIRFFTEGLEALRRHEARQRLKVIDATMPPIEPPKSANWTTIAIVALALVVAAFAVYRFVVVQPVQKAKPKPSTAIVAYFEPYPALEITAGEEEEDVKGEALRLYSDNNFEEAIPLFQKSFDIEKDSMQLFYKGVSFLGNGQTQNAISLLEPMQGSSTFPMESVDWYLGLAYLANSQREKALFLVQKTANTEGVLRAKAVDLLRKM